MAKCRDICLPLTFIDKRGEVRVQRERIREEANGAICYPKQKQNIHA